MVELGYVADDDITALLSRQYGVPSIDLSQFDIDLAVISTIPPETARKYQVVPLSRSGPTLTIAMTDPTNVCAIDDIKFMTGYAVETVMASDSMGTRYFGSNQGGTIFQAYQSVPVTQSGAPNGATPIQ